MTEATSTTSILIVEDESIVAWDLQHTLERLGYRVAGIADNAKDALKLAETEKPDLVLQDIMIKGEDNGIVSSKQISENFHIPVIFLTAYSDSPTLQKAKATLPYGYILKPFNERDMHTTIEMALELHKSREKLREAEEHYATILESTCDAVIATDINGNITFMNHIASRLSGWVLTEASGKPLSDIFNIINAHTRQSIYTSGNEEIKERVTIPAESYSLLISKDGEEHPIEDSTAHIYNRKGEMTGSVLILRDISDRKKHEDALAKKEAELRQLQKMDSVGRLAGGIAHDFNNMLTAILGYSRFVLDGVGEDHEVTEDVKEIIKTGERAADLTKQILAFSRRAHSPAHSVSVNHTIKEVEPMLRRTIDSGINLVLKLDKESGAILAEPVQLHQVVMNLVVNACDAMPQGGSLSITTSPVELSDDDCKHLPNITAGDYAKISVKDTGSGMSKEIKEFAFDPFFTTKGIGEGTGLGLSIVYGIVQQYKGFIELTSHLNQGTAVDIFLPTTDAAPLMPSRFKKDEVPRGAETILVVDDELPVLNYTTRALKQIGYKVISADHPFKALALCDQYEGKIDLLVSDVVMPEMNGFQLSEACKEKIPDINVLFISGYTENSYTQLGDTGIVHSFIPKPFTIETISQKVRDILDKVHSDHQNA